MTENNKINHDLLGKKLSREMNVLELCSQVRHSSRPIKRLGIKKYNWWNESLHGVARAGIATVFPQAIAMASTFDENIVFKVASIISNEARAKYNYSQSIKDYGIYKGLTMWSPNINIFRDPRWGRGQETYGEDPYLTSKFGVAFIKGLQGDDDKYIKTSACAKHFVVHSGPEAERHSFNSVASKKDMFETYLPAFKAAVIEGKVSGVMGAYNRTNGEACCASPTLMKTLLRDNWKFDGYYVSDCAALLDIVFKHKIEKNPFKAAALAMNSGCDLECGVLYNLLPFAKMFGYVSKETLRESVARLVSIRSQLGMFDENCKYNKIDLNENATEENENFAIDVARKSIVLLENDGILPLTPNKQNILLTGYNAENEIAYLGNYYGEPSSYIKVLDAIKKENKNTIYSQGTHLYNKNKKIDKNEAIEKAKNSDVIIVCTGLDSSIEGEEAGGMLAGGGGSLGKQGDRISLELPKVQQDFLEDLISLNKKVIILNFSGGCIDFRKYKDRVNAILQCWYPGAKAGKAIADILFGKTSPSGKLPITFYNSVDDLPPFEDYNMQGRTYRYYNGKVQYPFGYGLTYTDFNLVNSSFNSDSNTITLTIKNTGNHTCDEVLQLYVSYPQTDYPMPIKSLIKTKRIEIPVNKEVEVKFTIDEKDLYSFDNDGNEVFLNGTYKFNLSDGQNINTDCCEIVNNNSTKIIEKCCL